MSVAYRSTCRPTIGQSLSVDISANISVEGRSTYRGLVDISTDMPVDMSTETSRSTYRPTLDRYVCRHINQYSTDTLVEYRLICRLIYRSRGAQNTHDPNNLPFDNKLLLCKGKLCHKCMYTGNCFYRF